MKKQLLIVLMVNIVLATVFVAECTGDTTNTTGTSPAATSTATTTPTLSPSPSPKATPVPTATTAKTPVRTPTAHAPGCNLLVIQAHMFLLCPVSMHLKTTLNINQHSSRDMKEVWAPNLVVLRNFLNYLCSVDSYLREVRVLYIICDT